MSYCFKTSDNKHFGCPPRMSDGRHFTDYRPSCQVNNMIKADNGTQNSFQYRQFLAHNAVELMNINRRHACEKNCCAPDQSLFNEGTMLPELNKKVCDKNSCMIVANNPDGLGTGRMYQPDQECQYLPSAWPVSKNNVCVSPKEAGNFYPLDKNVYNTTQRLSVPGGGRMIQDAGDHKMLN